MKHLGNKIRFAQAYVHNSTIKNYIVFVCFCSFAVCLSSAKFPLKATITNTFGYHLFLLGARTVRLIVAWHWQGKQQLILVRIIVTSLVSVVWLELFSYICESINWLNRHSSCLQAGYLCWRGFNPDMR